MSTISLCRVTKYETEKSLTLANFTRVLKFKYQDLIEERMALI